MRVIWFTGTLPPTSVPNGARAKVGLFVDSKKVERLLVFRDGWQDAETGEDFVATAGEWAPTYPAWWAKSLQDVLLARRRDAKAKRKQKQRGTTP